jgi:hypothetical protein
VILIKKLEIMLTEIPVCVILTDWSVIMADEIIRPGGQHI